MKFAGTDLGDYGMTVLLKGGDAGAPPLINPIDNVIDNGITYTSRLETRVISMSAVVSAASKALLATALDNIKLLLNPQLGEQALYLDFPPSYDRFYTAKLDSLPQYLIQGTVAITDLSFVCADPLAYSDSLTSVNKDLNALGSDPYDWNETPGGSAINRKAEFVITSPAVGTVILQNITTGDTLTMTSDGSNITVDCDTFSCSGATAFSGHWPRLQPGTANNIKITGAGTGAGTELDLTYRDCYL